MRDGQEKREGRIGGYRGERVWGGPAELRPTRPRAVWSTVSVCVCVCVFYCTVDQYKVNFVPRESGLHYVHVKRNGVHVSGSPYPVQVERLDADASQVRAYGDGLYEGFTGRYKLLYIIIV